MDGFQPVTDEEVAAMIRTEYRKDAGGHRAEAEKILAAAAPAAARTIVALSLNGVNERIRFQASQYILEKTGVYGSGGGEASPYESILGTVLREPSTEELG